MSKIEFFMKKIFFCLCLFCSIIAKAQVDDNTIVAMNLVTKNQTAIGLSTTDLSNIIVSNAYFDKTTNLMMVYLQQSHYNLPVYNQLQVLAFKNDVLVSNSGSRIKAIEKITKGNKGIPQISAEMAVMTALSDRKLPTTQKPIVVGSEKNGHLVVFDNMGISRENITAELMWVPLEDGKKVVLAWQVYIIPVSSSDYWMIRINAIDNSIIGVNNLTVYCNWDDHSKEKLSKKNSPQKDVEKNNAPATLFDLFDIRASNQKQQSSSRPSMISNATYRVVPFPYESPKHFTDTTALVTNPWSAAPGNATTLNWHNNGTTDYIYTRGNNVWAQEDANNNNGTGTPATSTTTVDPLNFNFVPNFTVTPTQTTPVKNQQFNITNLFYWNNIMHDVMYQYGFDEVSGNFQASNMGRGGSGNDYVLADAQDGGGTFNANFATPADGTSGRMQMYLWGGTPQKDGDVDNGVMCHEYAHGISNRLTGGPSQAGCLQNNEQMGEGWSDYYGLMFTQDWANSDTSSGRLSSRPVGTYANNQSPTGAGIRTQKYSTNLTVNSRKYATSISAESHTRGEIWCATLWDMTWNIITQLNSINPNLYDANGGGGNTIALKLVTEGMKLQPCSPGFIDGRNAILKADQILYGGAYSCAIWEAFRRRGMGPLASQGSSNSVTDQVTDFTLGTASLQLTESVSQVPEGQTITFTNTLTAGNCAAVVNFKLTDTLPSNVTYVSGGTYTTSNRVVSFVVNLNPGQTQAYAFTVRLNTGSYYPTISLFEDSVPGFIVPPTWTTTSTTATNWDVSSARSYSPTNSYFSSNLDVPSDEKLTLTNAINLGANPPSLTFRHWYNAESTYDGGVLEVSTNNGVTWTDMSANIISGGYTYLMDTSTILKTRKAWTGSSNDRFIKTKVRLTPYANQNIKIRFRFTSDEGTANEGWYVDDIAIKDQAVVEMQSNLFNAAFARVATSDTFAIILPVSTCTGASINTQPLNTSVCIGDSARFNVVASGTNPTYQWQISIDGGITFTDISGAIGNAYAILCNNNNQNNQRFRVVVSTTCGNATSNPVTLTVNILPSITTSPVNASNVCIGSNNTFSVIATGTSLTYQWQISTNGGGLFANINGAISATYSITNTLFSQNNNQYRVVISGPCTGVVTSLPATLTVSASTNSSTTQAACDSYVWNSVTYSASGNYQYNYTNGNGCPSVDTLHLTINSGSHLSSTASACGSYVWSKNGQTYTSSGNYTYSYTNGNGCLSADTLHLTINPILNTGSTISNCTSYLWKGTTYTTSGTYTFANGCSTDTLHLTIKATSSSTAANATCSSYSWNGITYTTSGAKTWTGTNAAGCDSTATLNLTIKQPTISNASASACISYSWNGTTYTTSGAKTWTGTNAAGCDSTAILNLIIKQPTSFTQVVSSCSFYIWHGNTYTTSTNSPIWTGVNAAGCDSLVTLNLTIKLPSSSTESPVSVCSSYSWHGITYTTSGTKTWIGTNAVGCDSVVSLDLNIKATTSSTEPPVSICETYSWHGSTYSTSGTKTWTGNNAAGCDSIVTLNLTIKKATSSITSMGKCPNELPFVWNSLTFNNAGSQTAILTNAAGCDSSATLNFIIKQPTSSTQIVSACGSYSWHGNTYSSSTNTPTWTGTNAVGCDSVVTLNLTIKQATSSTEAPVSICEKYSWHGSTYSTSGTKTWIGTNAVGCDSMVTLNLTIKKATSSSITIDTSSYSYTWNGTTYNYSGTYTFTATNAVGCDSTITLHLTLPSISVISPNPTTNGRFKVNLNAFKMDDILSRNVQLSIYDESGKKILIQKLTTLVTEIDLLKNANAIYFIRIQSADNSIKYSAKVLKGN